MTNKKNLPLYIALAIPVIMIIAVGLAIYLPGLSKSPQYNFLYMTGDGINYGYPGGADYYVQGGKLIKNIIPLPQTPEPYYQRYSQGDVKFYMHNVTSNESTEVTFEQAQSFNLDSSQGSPDGYQVIQGNYGGDFLFGSSNGDYNNWYLKGNNRSKKLNAKLIGTTSYGNFRFLGWIE